MNTPQFCVVEEGEPVIPQDGKAATEFAAKEKNKKIVLVDKIRSDAKVFRAELLAVNDLGEA